VLCLTFFVKVAGEYNFFKPRHLQLIVHLLVGLPGLCPTAVGRGELGRLGVCRMHQAHFSEVNAACLLGLLPGLSSCLALARATELCFELSVHRDPKLLSQLLNVTCFHLKSCKTARFTHLSQNQVWACSERAWPDIHWSHEIQSLFQRQAGAALRVLGALVALGACDRYSGFSTEAVWKGRSDSCPLYPDKRHVPIHLSSPGSELTRCCRSSEPCSEQHKICRGFLSDSRGAELDQNNTWGVSSSFLLGCLRRLRKVACWTQRWEVQSC